MTGQLLNQSTPIWNRRLNSSGEYNLIHRGTEFFNQLWQV